MRSDITIDEELLLHADFLRGLAGRLVGPEDAEDVLQDTWLALRAHAPRAPGKLRGWLAIVVANLARNRLRAGERRRGREERAARPEREEPDAAALERLELQRFLGELVAALPAEQRIVLYLRYFEDLTPSAIAERLDVPLKTIKTRHTRALAALRARLDERSHGDRSAWVSALLAWARPRPGTAGVPLLAKLAAVALVLASLGLALLHRPEGPGEHGRVVLRAKPVESALAAFPAALEPPAAAVAPPSRVEAVSADRRTLELDPAPPRPEGELVLVVEADLSRIRALGWTAPEADDAQALEQARAIVARRFEALRRSVEVAPDAERRRIQITLSSSAPRDRELCAELVHGIGVCELLWLVDEELELALDLPFDLRSERDRLDLWQETHPSAPLEAFHSVPRHAGGPHPRLCWIETLFGDKTGPPHALLLPDGPEDAIGAGSFLRCTPATDDFGYPALSIELVASRSNDLLRLSRGRLDLRLAIVLDGKIRSAPTVKDVLDRGTLLVEGRFTEQDAERLAEALAAPRGPLRVVEVR